MLVVGSSNTDMTVRLPRLPEPGQTVLGGALRVGPGGKGANQAVAAARAGGEVVFLTAVGGDEFGTRALEGYRREGINVAHAVIVGGEPSGVALIFVDDRGENMISVAPGANLHLGPGDVSRLPDSLFAADRLLLVAGLEVPLEAVRAATRRARRALMTVLMNPAPAHPGLAASDTLDDVDVLTPNRLELAQLTGLRTETIDDVAVACGVLRSRHPDLAVVVTLGAEGGFLSSDRSTGRFAARTVEAVDTVGAGDAFSGALAVALAGGRSLADSVAWAAAAAALAVTRPGAQAGLPFRAEIDRFSAGTGRDG